MITFHTQVKSGYYKLMFETNDKEYFQFVQEAARKCIDGEELKNTVNKLMEK